MKKGVNIFLTYKKKNAQIWVETVVYTLIVLALLGAVLGFAKPKIEKMQDEIIIKDSINILEEINSIIEDIKKVPGNKRQIEIAIRKGDLTFDSKNDLIIFNLDTRFEYSEPGIPIDVGNVKIVNKKIGEINKINLTLNYTNKYDLRWKDKTDGLEKLPKSSTNYKIFISSQDSVGSPIINFEII